VVRAVQIAHIHSWLPKYEQSAVGVQAAQLEVITIGFCGGYSDVAARVER
jgi:hypothetical protein